jgi:hypothetical protein
MVTVPAAVAVKDTAQIAVLPRPASRHVPPPPKLPVGLVKMIEPVGIPPLGPEASEAMTAQAAVCCAVRIPGEHVTVRVGATNGPGAAGTVTVAVAGAAVPPRPVA